MKVFVLVPNADAAFAEAARRAGAIPVESISDRLDGQAVAHGTTSRETLAQVERLVAAGESPFARGGLDRDTIARVAAAGAAGIVLGESLWLLPESPLPEADRDALARLTFADFAKGDVTLPSGLSVGRDALLASFVARRAGTLERALAFAREDAARVPPPEPEPQPTATKWPFETRPVKESVAIVGVGCVLPKARNAQEFWRNVLAKEYCITEVPKDRWDPDVYFDADPTVPDKTYTKIGGFVTDFEFDSLKFRIPPATARALDIVQQMTLAAVAEALADSGYDKKEFDRSRTAVILGNSMGGEIRDLYARRIYAAEFAASVREHMPADVAAAALRKYTEKFPPVTEDSMPGELSNVIAGRVANVFNLGGKNCTVDAACASSLAALETAIQGLASGQFDMAVCGGADRSMDVATYIKFCKIGALSPDGSRPFDAGANGFVMGEGAAVVVLKRLSDAVRDGDRIHAVVRATGSSSDGKGKGITAPNPVGQELAVTRAMEAARLAPKHVQLVEAHGTSTRVGDVVEVQVLSKLYAELPVGSVALGSVKSQIGHLKSAAGAAGLVKAALALRENVLPPSVNFETPNPNIAWGTSPFFVNTEARAWPAPANGEPRRAAVSAFGFGGTNFHCVVEEYVPAYHGAATSQAAPRAARAPAATVSVPLAPSAEADVVLLSSDAPDGIAAAAARVTSADGSLPAVAAASRAALRGRLRLAVAVPSKDELPQRVRDVVALAADPAKRAALPMKGAFLGEGAPTGKVAFLFPGQGSQYANMLRDLAAKYRVVSETFAEADRVLTPLLGHELTDVLFADPADKAAVAKAEDALRRTEITQPAVLAADVALHRLLTSWGVEPDVVAGHSLGEYAALVAGGVLSFEDALVAVSARGREMANVHVPDHGKMAGVAASPAEVEDVLRGIDGYVVAANKNCPAQTVIAGASAAVDAAVKAFESKGIGVQLLNVSAAFHTDIVAPASAPLRRVLEELTIRAPEIPVSTNVTAGRYPAERDAILDLLSKQVAAPVEWEQQLRNLYDDGVRVFVEVGPKRALAGFVESTLGERGDVVSVFVNHPKKGDVASLNEAAARLLALGVDVALPSPDDRGAYTDAFIERFARAPAPVTFTPSTPRASQPLPAAAPVAARASGKPADAPVRSAAVAPADDAPGGFDEFLAALRPHMEREFEARVGASTRRLAAFEARGFDADDVVVTGASVGLPGRANRVFDDDNVKRLLRGENRIDRLAENEQGGFLDKGIVRVVKSDAEPVFERIADGEQAIKLAGMKGEFDLSRDYGLPADVARSLDVTTKLAVAAAIEALRDAGIPLVREDVRTTTGRTLPGGYALPRELREGTGIVFASAFPGLDNLVADLSRYHAWRFGRAAYDDLVDLYASFIADVKDPEARRRATAWFDKHRDVLAKSAGSEAEVYEFSRKFLFEILALGHAQVAELLKARGPAVAVNAACASTTLALATAEDWLRTGRAERVIVVGADDATSENLMPWLGSGFLAAGAATTSGAVEEAALPFDRRRHGMIVGMGAVGIVLERRRDADARGLVPVAALVGTKIANSAYHGSRLDQEHIASCVQELVNRAAALESTTPQDLARASLFVSHETFTPARGGSAGAEIAALRRAFGDAARDVLVVNTKGYTGHPMGAGVEDTAAVKMLQYGVSPPIPNFREPDPELGDITLSTGGAHDRRYALRLAAGFGSQLALAFFRREAVGDARIADAAKHQAWLDGLAGRSNVATEVVNRTLRVAGAATAPPPAVAQSAPVAVRAPVPVPAAAPTGPSREEVVKRVLDVVAAKTGYPVDMLDPALDMEADLGVDTVKQAEIFGSLREIWSLPREEGVKIKDYPTLNHVADYLVSRLGAAPSTPAPAAPVPAAPPPATAPAPAPGPAPTTPPAQPAPAAPAARDVLERVRALIAEKTGYPTDMLDPELDLEADLGIDTVKQAEIFGEVRGLFGIPRVEGVKIKDYPTLGRVADFVREQLASAAPAVAAPAETVAPAPAAQAAAEEWPPVRRVPVDVPAPLGGNPRDVRGRRFVVTEDGGGVATALADKLRASGADVAIVASGDEPPSDADALVHVAPLGGRGDSRDLFRMARAMAARVLDANGVVVAAANEGALEADALAGMCRALAREFPGATVRAVAFGDVSTGVAEALFREIVTPSADAAVAYRGGERSTRIVLEAPFVADGVGIPLESGDLVVASGGAAGITLEMVRALAREVPGLRFLLLGRTPPRDDAAALAALDAHGWDAKRAGAKADLEARGERVTPVAIERALRPLRRAADVHVALASIRELGAEATYAALDVADAAEVSRAVAEARASFGPVKMILHGAGVEESRRFTDKDDAAFDRAWSPKVDGARALAAATIDDPVRAFFLFGSVAGVFGNATQADYSAANAALAAVVRDLRTRGTPARVLAWTAWGETGMATRGSTLTVLDAIGVEPLATADGVRLFLDELRHADAPQDVVVLARRLGALDAPSADDAARTEAAEAARAASLERFRLIDRVERASASSVRVRRTLDPDEPFLKDHAVDGVPYLPGVFGLEAFAEAAALVAPHCRVVAFEDAEFASPVKVRAAALEVAVDVALAQARPDGTVLADARLVSFPKLGGERVHFSARVVLAPRDAAVEAAPVDAPAAVPWRAARDAVYAHYFHGPAFRVLGAGTALAPGGVRAVTSAPDVTPFATGAHAFAAAPFVAEALLQASGLWGLVVEGQASLPVGIKRLVVADPAAALDGVEVTARVVATDERGVTYDAAAVSPDGRVVMRADGIVLARTGDVEPAAEAFAAAPWPVERVALGGRDVFRVPVEWGAELLSTDADAASRLVPATEFDAPTDLRRAERFAAALAARSALAAATGAPARTLRVGRDEDGAPATLTIGGAAWSVSVAHAAGWAVAVAFRPDVEAVGVDVERVEARADAWREEAFTPAERSRLRSPEDEARAWCAKEAVLKALRKGLSEDLHAVDVTLLPSGRATVDATGGVKEAAIAMGLTDLAVETAAWPEPAPAAAAVAIASLARS